MLKISLKNKLWVNIMGNCCRQQVEIEPPECNSNKAPKRNVSNFTFAKSRYSSESTLKLPPTFSDPVLFTAEPNDNSREIFDQIQEIPDED
ncbi:unnamed protein product [Blepharisma stoltei]|uniref:Uncharacterized protein n=1 Tax=Blepharisma stoltei TaxID=1481888 RepID=A0AAU9I7R1_9CILI|nr:unnamed protein product [Blepharisma stoltei]